MPYFQIIYCETFCAKIFKFLNKILKGKFIKKILATQKIKNIIFNKVCL